MQSRDTQITMVKWTNAGGQTKRANERSFVYRPPALRRWRNVKTPYWKGLLIHSSLWCNHRITFICGNYEERIAHYSILVFVIFLLVLLFGWTLSALLNGCAAHSQYEDAERFMSRTWSTWKVPRLNQLGTPFSIWNGSAVLFA